MAGCLHFQTSITISTTACVGEKSQQRFFDIDEAIRAVKMISPDNREGFKKADLDKLVSWIESRDSKKKLILWKSLIP
jgi:hypothetical protein